MSEEQAQGYLYRLDGRVGQAHADPYDAKLAIRDGRNTNPAISAPNSRDLRFPNIGNQIVL